ncbi:hypothetical protein HZC34_08080 [Candidatus Saganbacteria bacterium]|nr:hypothetical protein [Candidatus Saganbacteria bacterium]
MFKSWFFLFVKVTSDVFFINLSFVFGYMIKSRSVNIFASQISPYFKVLMFLTVFWLIIFNLAGMYKMQLDMKNRVDNIFSVSFGVFSASFFTYILVAYIYREAIYTKEIVIFGSIIGALLINLSRFVIWKIYCMMNNERA